MRERTDRESSDKLPSWAMAGRTAALAAFDRGDDAAELATLTTETPPVPEESRGEATGQAGEETDGTARGEVRPEVTTLRFDHGRLGLDLQVRSHGRHRSLSGLVTGDFDHATVDVRRPGSSDRLRVGADGRFTVPDLERGPLSLAVLRADRPLVVTGWFTV